MTNTQKQNSMMTAREQWTDEQKQCFKEYKILRIKIKALQELNAMASDDIAEAQGYYLQNKNEYDRGYIHGMQKIREGAITRLIRNLQNEIDKKVEEFGSMERGNNHE